MNLKLEGQHPQAFSVHNSTFSAEYNIGDLTIGYEHQIEQEQQDGNDKVAELSRKANNREK